MAILYHTVAVVDIEIHQGQKITTWPIKYPHIKKNAQRFLLTALPGSVNSTHEPIPEVCGPAGLCVVHIHTWTHSIRHKCGTCVQIMAFPHTR